MDEAEIIPLAHASFWSRLTFRWVSPLIRTGFRRPLQPTDLWKMDESRECGYSLGAKEPYTAPR